MAITRLDKLLNAGTGGRLRKIVQNAKNLEDLTTALRARLGPDTAAALLSANCRDGELVLMVTSPAWASRLRFESSDLLAAAREAGARADRVSVRVAHGDQA